MPVCRHRHFRVVNNNVHSQRHIFVRNHASSRHADTPSSHLVRVAAQRDLLGHFPRMFPVWGDGVRQDVSFYDVWRNYMLLLLVVCLTFPPDSDGLIHTFRLLFCLTPDIPEVHFCPRQGSFCVENSALYATFNKPSTRFAAPSGFSCNVVLLHAVDVIPFFSMNDTIVNVSPEASAQMR